MATANINKRTLKSLMTMVADGMSNKEMAKEVGMSEATIEKELQFIYAGIGVKSKSRPNRRCEAVAIAFRNGWIT